MTLVQFWLFETHCWATQTIPRTGSSETRPGLRQRLQKSKSQFRDRDYKSYSLSSETKIKTFYLIVSVTRPRLRLGILVSRSRLRSKPGLNANNLWGFMALDGKGLIYSWFDQIEAVSTDNPYDILIVNLRDSKNKRCRDRDFSRPEILRDIDTETLWDQERMSRPRTAETEQKLSRPRLYRESR